MTMKRRKSNQTPQEYTVTVSGYRNGVPVEDTMYITANTASAASIQAEDYFMSLGYDSVMTEEVFVEENNTMDFIGFHTVNPFDTKKFGVCIADDCE